MLHHVRPANHPVPDGPGVPVGDPGDVPEKLEVHSPPPSSGSGVAPGPCASSTTTSSTCSKAGLGYDPPFVDPLHQDDLVELVQDNFLQNQRHKGVGEYAHATSTVICTST